MAHARGVVVMMMHNVGDLDHDMTIMIAMVMMMSVMIIIVIVVIAGNCCLSSQADAYVVLVLVVS